MLSDEDINTAFCQLIYPFQNTALGNGRTSYGVILPGPASCNLTPSACTKSKPPLNTPPPPK